MQMIQKTIDDAKSKMVKTMSLKRKVSPRFRVQLKE